MDYMLRGAEGPVGEEGRDEKERGIMLPCHL